jgi:hypothetical protein
MKIMEFDTFLARTLIHFDISMLAKRGKRREQMTDCDEKFADAMSKNLQYPTI